MASLGQSREGRSTSLNLLATLFFICPKCRSETLSWNCIYTKKMEFPQYLGKKAAVNHHTQDEPPLAFLTMGTLLFTTKLSSSLEIQNQITGLRRSQRTAGYSIGLPNAPPRLICLSSRELFWQLCMQVCELTPYAMQKSILSLPSFKDLKKKKKISNFQSGPAVLSTDLTVCRHSSTVLIEKHFTIFRA